LAKLQIT